LGIAAVDINGARMTRLELLMHLLPPETRWRDHGRRIAAGNGSAKVRRGAAAGYRGDQALSGGC
jgi:hypothetical protein